MSAGTRRGSWRVALRLARRDIRRSRGRSSLIAAMVGVPVMLVVTLSTLVHTNDISPREALTSTLGQSAALISTTGGDVQQPVIQDPSTSSWETDPNTSVTNTAKSLSGSQIQHLTGGRLLPLWSDHVGLSHDGTNLSVQSTELDWSDPATRGMLHLTSGRLPTAAGELAVTPGLAASGWRIGQRVTDLVTGRSLQIVGTVTTLGLGRHDQDAYAMPGALRATSADADSIGAASSYLLVRDQPVSWAEVQRLNHVGLLVESRAVVTDPPSRSAESAEQRQLSSGDAATRAVVVIVIVSIVIEVVLLAGPAFAVGVRRRRRDLALLAATGSTPRDIRRSVLAQAAILGVSAAALGALLGLPLARLAMPVAEHYGATLGPYDWRWKELVFTLIVGGVAAVLAALVPALQAARDDVATVLAGRRGVLRSRAGWPVLGIVLIGAGAGVALTLGTRPGGELWVAGSSIVIVLGAVAATPWLIGQVGRLATRLPLPLRLATRDAARQRGRTAPAVAAIMASVIGITALAIGFASDTKQARRDYEPRAAMGTALVALPAADRAQEITDAIDAVLPGRAVYGGLSLDGDGGINASPQTRISNVVVAPPNCTLLSAAGRAADSDADCVQAWDSVNSEGQAAAYSEAALEAFGVPMTPQARAVLDAGGVLVASASALRGDHVLVGVVSTRTDGTRSKVVRQMLVPGGLLPTAGPQVIRLATVVMTPQTAQRLGVTGQSSTLAIGGPVLTSAQESKLDSALLAQQADLYVERGFHQTYGLVLALLALIGGLVVLVATVTATGLAMSEARPDLATLAAVGAPPRTRRLIASAQAVVIGLLGTVLGVALGFVPGLAVTWPLTVVDYGTPQPGVSHPTGPVIAIPWTLLIVVVIAVPVVSGLVTGLFTRSRLPMVRRLAT